MPYIGIDYGDKKIGLAVSYDKKTALPYDTIDNDGEVYVNLKKIIKEVSADLVVVGIPYTLSGGKNERIEKTYKFVEDLKKHIPDIKVMVYDERYTSKIAQQNRNLYGSAADVHQLSAFVILEDFCLYNKIDKKS